MGLLNPSTEIVELGNPGLDVEGNRFLAVLNYRYSLNSSVDLTGDLRSWGGPWTTPASQHVKLGVYLVGPGMRLISIPIEATYIGTSGDDIDDLSGFGFSSGVNFSF